MISQAFVKRLLVDEGNSMNLITLEVFQALGCSLEDVEWVANTLIFRYFVDFLVVYLYNINENKKN